MTHVTRSVTSLDDVTLHLITRPAPLVWRQLRLELASIESCCLVRLLTSVQRMSQPLPGLMRVTWSHWRESLGRGHLRGEAGRRTSREGEVHKSRQIGCQQSATEMEVNIKIISVRMTIFTPDEERREVGGQYEESSEVEAEAAGESERSSDLQVSERSPCVQCDLLSDLRGQLDSCLRSSIEAG